MNNILRHSSAALAVIVMAKSLFAQPVPYYVNGTCGNNSWSGTNPICAAPDGPKATIQAAVDVANANDIIFLADGTYSSEYDRNILISKNLRIWSASGDPDLCIINCDNDGRAFRVAGNTDIDLCQIKGLTIRNGLVGDGVAPSTLVLSPAGIPLLGGDSVFGAGVETYSPVTISNCVFRNNVTTTGAGGAVFIGPGSGASVITDCVIEDNSAGAGGGLSLQCDPDPDEDLYVMVRRCIIRNNSAGAMGGGAFCHSGEGGSDARTAFIDCVFKDNTAGPSPFANAGNSYGGGLTAFHRSNVTVINSEIGGNQVLVATNFNGGGCGVAVLSFATGIEAVADLTNCLITRNGDDSGAPGPSQFGGGVLSGGGTLTMTNCTVAYNRSGGTLQGGGGGLCQSSFFGAPDAMAIRNCVFWQNSAAGEPQQIALNLVDDPTSIVSSDVEGGLAGILGIAEPDTYTGNIDMNPQFTNATAGNYALDYLSPLLNNGDASLLPPDAFDLDDDNVMAESIPYDFAGAARQVNSSGCVDIGALENQVAGSCVGDISGGASSGPDCVVDVNDLLIVINTWLTPGGAADIVPAPCGNGTVDVDELLAVINGWGPCPNSGCTADSEMPMSVQECYEKCGNQFPEGGPAFAAAFDACVEALCKASIIDCD